MPKPHPSFWWDFEKNYVIVESDDTEFPLIACYEVFKSADFQISLAEKLINDLNAERVNYRVLGKSFEKKFIQSIFPNYK